MEDGTVTTVTGPISLDSLGRTLVHEHVAFGYPGWDADASVAPFDYDAALDEAVEVCTTLADDYGLSTLVDATPNDMGRKPELLSDLAERTDLNVVCATGLYFEYRGADSYFKSRLAWSDVTEEIAELFRTEITQGIRDSDVRAGVIKVGTSLDEVTEYERCMLQAAGRVNAETGVPIVTHTERSTMGATQVEILTEAGGSPGDVMVGHAGGSELEYYEQILDSGAHLAFDQFGMERSVTDADRIDAIRRLADRGYSSQLHVSQDYVINFIGRNFDGLREYFPTHSPQRVFERAIPELSADDGFADPADRLLCRNVRDLFSS